MIKAEVGKILEWSQDRFFTIKKRMRELEVPFEYYDGYADALSHLDEYVEEMDTDTDPRLEMLDELEYSYKLDPNCVIETIDYFRDKIKQEAGE
jgi:hypothetical protein